MEVSADYRGSAKREADLHDMQEKAVVDDKRRKMKEEEDETTGEKRAQQKSNKAGQSPYNALRDKRRRIRQTSGAPRP